DFLLWPELSKKLNSLNAALDRNDMIAARATLAELVSGYSSTGEVSDLAFTGGETNPAHEDINALASGAGNQLRTTGA
ncbi:polysaccharide biosynthesis protein, partial [Rhizobium lentis]|nr:polysaccharide biosynthesis protein [Rhizobium lentis]